MSRKQDHKLHTENVSAQPHLHQTAREIQSYGTVSHLLPLQLEEPVRLEMTAQPNYLLADTMTLRDLYNRLLDAHQVIILETRKLARRAIELGDDGSNDFLVSEVLRTNDLQVWFLSEHLVKVPLVDAREPSSAAGAA